MEMTLTLERDKEFVNQFHYDARNYEWEKENGTPETNINVQFQLLPHEQIPQGYSNLCDFNIHDSIREYCIVRYAQSA